MQLSLVSFANSNLAIIIVAGLFMLLPTVFTIMPSFKLTIAAVITVTTSVIFLRNSRVSDEVKNL